MKATGRNIFESVMEEQQDHDLAERRVAARAAVLASVYHAPECFVADLSRPPRAPEGPRGSTHLL
jgi:hypothetical protein